MHQSVHFTVYAEAASARYELLVGSWRAIYSHALNGPTFGSVQQQAEVSSEAFRLARQFLQAELDHITRAFADIALEAQGVTQKQLDVTVADTLSEAAQTHLSDAESYLFSELSVQVERDVNMLLEALKRAALQVRLSAKARGISPKAALIEYLLSSSLELQFFFHDRGNQKWPSRKFVRSVWRHALLSAYNEVVLLTLADHRIDRAFVLHTDPASQFHGLEISVSTNSALPTYSEVRNEIFHPNSNAILVYSQE
jgi:hypothetical protein